MNRQDAHQLIDRLYDMQEASPEGTETVTVDAPQRELPEGKRVVRTKTSGDRVYLLDEKEKTRHWITSPEAMSNAGFEMSDVTEIEDSELQQSYRMGAPIYK